MLSGHVKNIFLFLGNSVYGKMITNKEKHRNIVYSSDSKKTSQSVRDFKFVSLEEISPDFYEIVNEKRQITLDIPVVLGFTILQLAKLRMLEFYYDFIDR